SDRVVWLDLDDRDDDPGRLRKRVLEQFDLDARVFDAGDVDDDWVRRLDGRIHDTVVVCDGVDVIDDPVTGGDLDSLCSHGPAGSRAGSGAGWPPPLPSLTRLRLAGELHEVLPDDLRCRDDEAAEILAAFGVPAAAGEQHDLVERTEGLVAAIALTGVL